MIILSMNWPISICAEQQHKKELTGALPLFNMSSCCPVRYIPALRSGFLSVIGFCAVVDELASSVVCREMYSSDTTVGDSHHDCTDV